MSPEKAEPQDIKQRTFQLALAVVRLCRELDKRAGVGRTLSKQLLRSGTSIGANVEEAQAGQSRADFLSKYAIALKETRETLYWLRLLEAAGEMPGGSCKLLIAEAEEIGNVIGSIIVKVKSRG